MDRTFDSADCRSATSRGMIIADAFRHFDCGLRLLERLDCDAYCQMALATCELADELQSTELDREPGQPGEPDRSWEPRYVTRHRTAIAILRPHSRPLQPSATASAIDMVALVRNLLSPR